MSLRLLHLADSHLGCDFPGQGPVARTRRAQQLVDAHRRAVAVALENSADLVIHSGDLFDTPRPPAFARLGAASALTQAAGAGLRVIVVAGNHEPGALAADLLLTHPGIRVFTQPGFMRLRIRDANVLVLGIPYQPTAAAFAAALRDGARHLAASDDYVILACHQTFRGAVCGAHLFRFTAGDDVVDPASLPRTISYVAAGHIHRHQIIGSGVLGGCPIVYAGSTDRISFAERDEAKGVVLADFAQGVARPRFVEHAVRSMLTLPLDFTGQTAAGLRRTLDEAILGLPRDAIAELRISGQVSPQVLRGLRLTTHARRLRPDVDLRVAMQAVRFVPARELSAKGEADGRPRLQPGGLTGVLDTSPKLGQSPTLKKGGAPAQKGGAPVPILENMSPAGALWGAAPCCVGVSAVGELRDEFGTYALYAADGRLLYVGKASKVRSRLRSHLRRTPQGNFFAGWGAQVAWVEVRPAESELEAALVEAEVIRRLRPPFNIQMRGWQEACYLVSTGDRFGQLAVARDPVPGARHFGPFGRRSSALLVLDAVNGFFGCAQCEATALPGVGLPLLGSSAAQLCGRYFAKQCSGPCAGRVSSGAYATRVALRDAFLAGEDDSTLRVVEEEVARATPEAMVGAAADWKRSVEMLRSIFDRTARLRRAVALLGSALVLPGRGDSRLVAQFDEDGVRFKRVGPPKLAEREFTISVRAEGPHSPLAAERLVAADRSRWGVIPKCMVEVLLVVERAVRRGTATDGGGGNGRDMTSSAGVPGVVNAREPILAIAAEAWSLPPVMRLAATSVNPGRCPGLLSFTPLGCKHQRCSTCPALFGDVEFHPVWVKASVHPELPGRNKIHAGMSRER